MSHEGPSDADAFAPLVARQTHFELLAKFSKRLRRVSESSGSVLHDTLVLWGNEVAEDNTHSHPNTLFQDGGRRLTLP